MKIKVKTSAIVYGIVAHDNRTERDNTTYAGKLLKNVIAYLSAGRHYGSKKPAGRFFCYT
jgi:hypothetical protein